MFRNRLYYGIKPLIPASARMAVRRWLAVKKRERVLDTWPILPGSEKVPENWTGWPEGKKFAFVLTHDVEGPGGLEKCRKLMKLEMELGFRSSFNFIPEGPYSVTKELRDELTANGFEVGVHDLRHDGKLYRTRKEFTQNAARINHYLKEWNAVGFRSGFMLRKLDWLHDLDVAYDGSSFDTDPFEPQPDGVGTIFPFWVPHPMGITGASPVNSGAPAGSPDRASDIRPLTSDSQFPLRSGDLSGLESDERHSPEAKVSKGPNEWERMSQRTDTRRSDSDVQRSMLDVRSSAASTSAQAVRPLTSDLRPLASSGYVELPYTLPQDSTLFLLFRERHPDIWFQKLDWIAQQGGMALLNVHPDYMNFDGKMRSNQEYPFSHYREFLKYVSQKYKGQFWQALPRDVAELVRCRHKMNSPVERSINDLRLNVRQTQSPVSNLNRGKTKQTIWIDLDNTPHVVFFEPIIEELRSRGFSVVVTARDAFQVCELADQKKLSYIKIGRHYGKNRFRKVAGLLYRALQLAPTALREKPVLSLSHGARSQIIISNLLGIRTLLLADYEFAKYPPLMRPTWEMVPSVIPDEALCCDRQHIRKYPGIKEDVYVWKFKPDDTFLPKLGLKNSDLIVTVRPPATEAHYHNPESEGLFVSFMERACQNPATRIVLLPRNKQQGEDIKERWPRWFENGKTIVPRALDGLNLIWHSDLLVSGGGTMNREAAALGVPVYSIFRGTMGAVDRYLEETGKLVMVGTSDDVAARIKLEKRQYKPLTEATSRRSLDHIINTIEELVETISSKK